MNVESMIAKSIRKYPDDWKMEGGVLRHKSDDYRVNIHASWGPMVNGEIANNHWWKLGRAYKWWRRRKSRLTLLGKREVLLPGDTKSTLPVPFDMTEVK